MSPHRSPFLILTAVLAILASSLLAGRPASAGAASPGDPVVLSGTVPAPVARGTATLLGPYVSDQPLRLVVALRAPHYAEEEAFLRQLNTPGTPVFHHFLSARQWDARYSPTMQDEMAVVTWAQQAGMRMRHLFANRLVVSLTAPVSTVESSLGVSINWYRLGDTTFFSNDRDPSVPASLGRIMLYIYGLNNWAVASPAIAPHPAQGRRAPAAPSTGPFVHIKGTYHLVPSKHGGHLRTQFRAGCNCIEPPDLWNSQGYDDNALQSLITCCNPFNVPGGPPETAIGIHTAADFQLSDIVSFIQKYGLAVTITVIQVDGSSPLSTDPASGSVEATLDVEWATAMAHSVDPQRAAHIYVYEAEDAYPGELEEALAQLADDNSARSYSTSWGSPETQTDLFSVVAQHQVYDQMLGEGWTMAAAAGDSGFTDDCSGPSVDYPASDPDVIAAGGTALSMDASGNFISEPAWSGNGCQSQNGGGGGGGCSIFFLPPSYQASDGISCPGAALRAVPDVALNAGSGQIVIFAGQQFIVGGTSIVAPELAGFFAHENAYLLRLNNLCAPSPCAPLGGFAAWALYHATVLPSTHDPFYDVVTGCNSSALGPGICTGPGYDLATGWGSFNFLQMAWDMNRMLMNDPTPPITAFGSNGPKINQWYRTNQIVGWAAVDSDPNPAHVVSGVAGATVGWDTIDANPFSHATPGSGDAFYRGPALPHTTLGGLDLKDAGQGCHTARLLAFDNVGHGSTASYGPVCYDSVPPVTTAHVSGTIGGRGYYLGPVQVTLTATDTTSGVAGTTYRLDCIYCSSKTYTSPITVTGSGYHAIFFRSTDKAGNAEVPQNVSFTIH